MSHVSDRGLRALRTTILAATTVLLAVTAHTLAGGGLPSFSGALLVAVPLACASAVLARRQLGPARLIAFLGASQWVMHQAFSGAAADFSTVTSASSHGHPAVAVGDAVAAHAHASTSITMTVLHVLATLATARLLTQGEQTLARLWTWLRARVLGPARIVVVPAHTVPAAPRWTAPIVRFLHAEDAPRRGPPARRVTPVLA